MGAFETSRSADRDCNPRRFEQLIGKSAVLEAVLRRNPTGRADWFHGSYPGRNRHRQGADRACCSRFQFTVRTSVH